MPETLNKSENNDGTGDQTQSESWVIPLQPPSPRGPGILTVKLGSAYRLSLPDDPDLDDSEATVPRILSLTRKCAMAAVRNRRI